MRFRTIICTALLALTFSVTAFGAEHTAQVVSFGHSVDTDAAIELTGSKVITDDFSFKMHMKKTAPASSFPSSVMKMSIIRI